MQKETMRPAGRIITYMPFVSWSIVVVFSRTTCSVDATLIKRPEGLPRFPDYDPAPRDAPREIDILYQKIARANGGDCSVAERRNPLHLSVFFASHKGDALLRDATTA